MKDTLTKPHGRQPSHLPPRELWTHDIYKDGKLETPLDERGLVDFKKLVSIGNSAVDLSYRWPAQRNDIHHLQWPRSCYEHDSRKADNPRTFRNLSISQARMPRSFHDWLHEIFQPPPVPDAEIMIYRIEAERVVKDLFRDAQQCVALTRIAHIPEHKLHMRLMQTYDSYASHYESAKQTPVDFLEIELDDFVPESIDKVQSFAPALGRVASMKTVALTTRTIRQRYEASAA